MRFLIDNIDISIGDSLSVVRRKAAERLGARLQGMRVEVVSRRWIRGENGGCVRVCVVAETNEFLRATSSFVPAPDIQCPTEPLKWKCRPVVVGFGVSGIIASLYLAKRGLKPIVLERGPGLEERPLPRSGKRTIMRDGEGSLLVQIGSLLRLSNLDPYLKKLLEDEGVSFDGPDSERFLSPVMVRSILRQLRDKVLSYGGEIYFNANYLGPKKRFGKIKGILFESEGKEKFIKTNKVLLAYGACDDTFLIGTSVPVPAQTFNEFAYGKKTIDSRYPLYFAESGLRNRTIKSFLLTGLVGARVVDIGSSAEMCLQAYNFDGKGNHVHTLFAVETTREEAFFVCSNAYDAGKPNRIPCSSVSDFYGKQNPLRLGTIKPEKISDIRLANYTGILGSGLAKRIATAFGQYSKSFSYLDSKDAIFEGLFMLPGCQDDEPKILDGICVSRVAAVKCMDFAAKATSGFKAARLLCE